MYELNSVTLNKRILSNSESMTENTGFQIGERLKGGTIVALHGELGSGKTVFTRGIARAMGIREPITSPSFALVQEYKGARWRLNHIDLYRIDKADDALAFGIEDYLRSESGVTVIEWAERISGLLGENLIHVCFDSTDFHEREIRIY
jgi:tRNA threonylcarbamoyladenosine biosynthesis protein TsaE